MSPDDHFLTNRKQSLIRSKQTPDPSVQFLVNMQTKKWSSGDIGNIVSFTIIFFQEPLKRWYGNVICMFILRSLTGLVTF
jgi:hypothetical protein